MPDIQQLLQMLQGGGGGSQNVTGSNTPVSGIQAPTPLSGLPLGAQGTGMAGEQGSAVSGAGGQGGGGGGPDLLQLLQLLGGGGTSGAGGGGGQLGTGIGATQIGQQGGAGGFQGGGYAAAGGAPSGGFGPYGIPEGGGGTYAAAGGAPSGYGGAGGGALGLLGPIAGILRQGVGVADLIKQGQQDPTGQQTAGSQQAAQFSGLGGPAYQGAGSEAAAAPGGGMDPGGGFGVAGSNTGLQGGGYAPPDTAGGFSGTQGPTDVYSNLGQTGGGGLAGGAPAAGGGGTLGGLGNIAGGLGGLAGLYQGISGGNPGQAIGGGAQLAGAAANAGLLGGASGAVGNVAGEVAPVVSILNAAGSINTPDYWKQAPPSVGQATANFIMDLLGTGSAFGLNIPGAIGGLTEALDAPSARYARGFAQDVMTGYGNTGQDINTAALDLAGRGQLSPRDLQLLQGQGAPGANATMHEGGQGFDWTPQIAALQAEQQYGQQTPQATGQQRLDAYNTDLSAQNTARNYQWINNMLRGFDFITPPNVYQQPTWSAPGGQFQTGGAPDFSQLQSPVQYALSQDPGGTAGLPDWVFSPGATGGFQFNRPTAPTWDPNAPIAFQGSA